MTTDATDQTGHHKPFTVPTTGILAIGRVTEAGAGDARMAVMPHEVRETVKLHLAGHISHWFSLTAAAGVVFILNETDVEEAHRMLADLPLGQAGMMDFELHPIGPLRPLNLLV